MKIDKFNELVDFIVEQRIRKVMCNKAAEYSRGDDKLYNFYRAAEVDRITPVEALRGMHLKHRVSVLDMLDDLQNDIHHPKELWHEKLTDTLNYYILMWAILSEEEQWEN